MLDFWNVVYLTASRKTCVNVPICVKPRLHDTTCCQGGCQTGLTTGCIVYTNIQPVVRPVWQPVWQPVDPVNGVSPWQISRWSVKSLLRYGDFWFFVTAAATILDFWNSEFLRVGRVKRDKMCHHAKFQGEKLNCWWDMTIFRFFKMAAATILDFQNLGNLGGGKGQEGQSASSRQIWRRSVKPLLRYGDFSIFPRWRLSAILDLWWVCLDRPRRAFGGLYRCAKFGWNHRCSFDNMHVFRFDQFGWKTTINAPKIGILGIWTHKWGGTSTKPQKAHPWGERRHMAYRSSKSVQRCDLCAWRRDEKRQRKKPNSGKLAIRRDHLRRQIEMKFRVVGGLWMIVLRFEFHQNRLSAFGAVGEL